MSDTALILRTSDIGKTESISDSIHRRGDVFWDAMGAVFGHAIEEAPDTDRNIPTIVTINEYGTYVPSYKDHFYNNIFMIPTDLEYGAIVSNITKEFHVWNAYLTPQTLQAVNVTDGEGFIMLNPAPPPSTYKALQLTPIQLTATPSGPPTADARFEFVFTSQSRTLRAVGIRVELWDFPPNWSGGYKVSYEYKTEIFTSRSKREQRRALRQSARKTVEYAVQTSGESNWKLRAILDAWQDKNFALPEVTRTTKSTSAMGAGSLKMTLANLPYWVAPESVVILQYGANSSLRIVESVDSDTNEVTYTSAGEETWPEGTIVYPGLIGRIDSEVQVSRPTSNISRLNFKMQVNPGSEPDMDIGTPDLTHRGREVFMRKPNWLNQVTLGAAWESEVLDYGKGVITAFPLHQFGNRIHRATYLSVSRDDAFAVEQFFHRMRGRQVAFYMPTWDADFMPSADLSELNRFMTVSGTMLARYYANSPVFRNMIIWFKDGTYLIRRIESIAEVGSNTVLDCETNWPRNISVSEIRSISWMLKWRFATDILSMEWLTDEVVQFNLSLMTLEDDPV